MKGAMAEPFANTNKAPTSTSVITIGASQYFLFSLMNCQSSLTTCAFDINNSLASLVGIQVRPNDFSSLAVFSSQYPTAVILESVCSRAFANDHSVVSWSGSGIRERVADKFTIGCVYGEARRAASANVSQPIIRNVDTRAADGHPGLTSAGNNVVPYGHVLHGSAKDDNAIAHDISNCSLI